MTPGPYVVCVVGKKDSGKTTLTVRLVAELRARGLRVMSVKHGHGFDVDRPGSDSWRHRHEGGAERVLMVAPDGMAMVGGWGPDGEPELRALVARYLGDAEVVVAEGYKVSDVPKIEVYRARAHAEPVFAPDHPHRESFLAIVTDRPDFRAPVPVLGLDDPELVSRLAGLVEERMERWGAADATSNPQELGETRRIPDRPL